MSWPICYADQLDIGDPHANAAVCTLWTPRSRVASQLERDSFAVVGNLYSRDGLNFLIRNVLAKPTIRYIVVCGKSLNDSDRALFALFANGVTSDWKIAGHAGAIDRDIPLEVIERLRTHVRLIDRRGAFSADEIRRVLSSLEPLPSFGEPLVLEPTPVALDSAPSEETGFQLRASSIWEGWIGLVYLILTFGQQTPTDHGTNQRELTTALVTVDEDDAPPPSWFPISEAELDAYADGFLKSDQAAPEAYAYGKRLLTHWGVDQVKTIVGDLQRFRYSRRGVASFWDPRTDPTSENPPCISLLQALVRRDRVVLNCFVRSHDVFRAWQYNVYALRRLQRAIAEELCAQPGPINMVSGSAHIYEDCWQAAQGLVEASAYKRVIARRFRQDPRGSFVVRLEDGGIAVHHYDPEGDRVGRFFGQTARDLSRQIEPYMSMVGHALYIGRELERAEAALKDGTQYVQDEVG